MPPDLLLPLLSYPDATPDLAVGSGVRLASRLRGELTVLTVQVHIPRSENRLQDLLLALDRQARLHETEGAVAANRVTELARAAASRARTTPRFETLFAALFDEGPAVAVASRTHDLCLLPLGPGLAASRSVAECVLFDSGRPVLGYPDAAPFDGDPGVGSVMIAWDGSAQAARAVAEALPFLHAAEDIEVFVMNCERPHPPGASARRLIEHLRVHAVHAHHVEEAAEAAHVGRRIIQRARERNADLLVMGGFRRGRVQEFMLGGVTDAVLQAPPCPVLLSH